MEWWGKAQGVPNLDKRRERAGFPIHLYVGANGGGKSLAMVWDTLPTLEAGLPVLSTVRLLDYENPRPCEGCDPAHLALWPSLAQAHERGHRQAHPSWVPFRWWDQLLSFSDGDVLMDEVAGVASSRSSTAMPSAVEVGLQQLRRGDVVLRATAPDWSRADTIIRETAQAVTLCAGSMKVYREESEGRQRRWGQSRLFEWRTYDATKFEDFTAGKAAEEPLLLKDHHWRESSVAHLAYDTFDAVSFVGTVTESGRCARCGGTRKPSPCKCEPVETTLWGGSAPVAPASAEREDADGVPAPGRRRRLDLIDTASG